MKEGPGKALKHALVNMVPWLIISMVAGFIGGWLITSFLSSFAGVIGVATLTSLTTIFVTWFIWKWANVDQYLSKYTK